jgi:uncharacterized protein (DUF362 family)
MTVLINNGRRNLKTAFHEIIDTFEADIDYQRGIFIKPNIVFPVRPRSYEITSPFMVKTFISTLRERYKRIDIVLGEGVAAGCEAQENFRVSGFTRLAQELGIPLLDLNRVERKTVPWKFGKLEFPCLVLERAYINMPILKPSSVCVISGALKNQKGLLRPAVKKSFHRHGLQEQIAELNVVVKPALTVMDCSRFFGRYILISGDNCGEIDATACHMLDIEEPEHVQLARDAQVFMPGYAVHHHGVNVKRITSRPAVQDFKHLGRLRLWSNPQACTMCRYFFRDIKQNMFKPKYLSADLKFLTYAIQGAEVLMGLNPQWKKEYQTVICIGNCTHRVAKEGGYIYIPGCPPTVDDFKNNI